MASQGIAPAAVAPGAADMLAALRLLEAVRDGDEHAVRVVASRCEPAVAAALLDIAVQTLAHLAPGEAERWLSLLWAQALAGEGDRP